MPSIDSQYRKGALELCVLALLDRRDMYGYELIQELHDTVEITEGTIYPLLRRMKTEGAVETYIKESLDGPARKYYRLTKGGMRKLNDQRAAWIVFTEKVNKLLRGRT